MTTICVYGVVSKDTALCVALCCHLCVYCVFYVCVHAHVHLLHVVTGPGDSKPQRPHTYWAGKGGSPLGSKDT